MQAYNYLLFMIKPRQPRQPRLQYHYFIPPQKYVDVLVQIGSQEEQIPKRTGNKLKRAETSGNIKFRGDEWNVYMMRDVCARINKWNIPKGFYVESSRQVDLIHQIVPIDFSTLLNLNLTNNSIQSIEPICNMMLPNLERLVLSNNKIVCIKSIRKCAFPKLVSCCLGGNKVIELAVLSQLHAAGLQYISQEHRGEWSWCDSFSWIGKLETNQLERFWISSDRRIWQRSAQNSFERKYLKRKEITFYVGMVHGVG